MRLIRLVIAALLVAVAPPLPAQVSLPARESSGLTELLKHLAPRVERAYYTSDSVELKNAAAALEVLTGGDSTGWHHGYYLGFIYRKLAEIVEDSDKDRAREFLDAAVENLESALEFEQTAETYALLALTHGSRMGVASMFAKIGVAGDAGDALENALELGPNNPRVLLVDGASRMYRPGMAGGGYERARHALNEALELWIVWKEDDPLMISWGKPAEIYARWAELEIRHGNAGNARRCIEYALEMQPDYAFVTDELMPMLNELEGR